MVIHDWRGRPFWDIILFSNKQIMKHGIARFDFYLSPLEKLLTDAAGQPDPGLWLYQNNARTPLFMLEGLARLYSGIHNKNRFFKIEGHFKLLEDALGAVDYYDGFVKQFSPDAAVPAEITKKVQAKAAEKTRQLNDLLRNKHWIGEDADRISKIRGKLNDADWLDEKSEVQAIERLYRESIGKINAFADKYRSGFTELETQVHELRRKLRWLSIYPQALQGCIQLTETPASDADLAKYLTPEIVNSPFNKMPAAGANAWVLMFNRDYFLALSWMIAELGNIKDEGLRFVVLNEAGAGSKAKSPDESGTLAKATAICRTYFAEGNLDKLLSGVVKANVWS